jgi:hypothetical protein
MKNMLKLFNIMGGTEDQAVEPTPPTKVELFLQNLEGALNSSPETFTYPISQMDFSEEVRPLFDRLRSVGFEPRMVSDKDKNEFLQIDLRDYEGPRYIKYLLEQLK